MPISAFDLFTIGIGPSSSHTVGPMRSAKMFVERLKAQNKLQLAKKVTVDLYGSLGATGRGHGSDKAVIAGLNSIAPESADPDEIARLVSDVSATRRLMLNGDQEIVFEPDF